MTRRIAISPSLASVRSLIRSGAARAIRQANRLSLAEVARDVGVTPTAVCRWEHGKRYPRGASALRYGRLLNELLEKNP